jgi:hypothetical protein
MRTFTAGSDVRRHDVDGGGDGAGSGGRARSTSRRRARSNSGDCPRTSVAGDRERMDGRFARGGRRRVETAGREQNQKRMAEQFARAGRTSPGCAVGRPRRVLWPGRGIGKSGEWTGRWTVPTARWRSGGTIPRAVAPRSTDAGGFRGGGCFVPRVQRRTSTARSTLDGESPSRRSASEPDSRPAVCERRAR